MTSRKPKAEARGVAMDLETAMEVIDDDLPNGAWFTMLSEMTGIDIGDLGGEIYALGKQKGWIVEQPKAKNPRPAARRKR